MALSPNYGFPEPDNSSLVKNGAQDIRALGDAIDTSVWNVGYGQAGKNMVTNGNQAISQRGTSFASNALNINIYTTDRFQARNGNFGEYTITQETDAPAGFENSAKWLCTTADASPAAADFLIYRTKFEGQQLQKLQYGSAGAQTTTLSFWVKSNLTGTFICQLFAEAPSNRNISASYTINAAATWEKKTITFAGDTVAALATGTNLAFNVIWFLGAGSDRTTGSLQTTWAAVSNTGAATGQTNLGSAINNYWQITGIQWEVGSKATPFQLAGGGSPQSELAMCQRYYYRVGGNNVYERFGQGYATSTTNVTVTFNQPVTMRIAPSAIDFSTVLVADGSSLFTVTGLTIDQAARNITSLNAAVASGLTQFRPYGCGANNSTSAFIGLSAEL
jgi:hypothetical protein